MFVWISVHKKIISESLSPSWYLWQIWKKNKYLKAFTKISQSWDSCELPGSSTSKQKFWSVHPWVQLVIYGHFLKVLLRYPVHKNGLDRQPKNLMPSAMAINDAVLKISFSIVHWSQSIQTYFFYMTNSNFQCLLSLMIKKSMPDDQLWPKNAWHFWRRHEI